jgi:hypothetical protein
MGAQARGAVEALRNLQSQSDPELEPYIVAAIKRINGKSGN